MLKRNITYEDYNGDTVTETFYFNLTQVEILDLEIGHEGGLEATIRRIVKTEDIKSLMSEFKNIILSSYGVKSEDGKRFIKSPQLREEFSQTAAYDTLFMELATDADALTTFIKAVVPSNLAKEIEKADLTIVPPVPPTSPFPPQSSPPVPPTKS